MGLEEGLEVGLEVGSEVGLEMELGAALEVHPSPRLRKR